MRPYVKGILFLTQDFIYVDSQRYLLIHQTDIISTYNKIQIFYLKTTNVCYYTSIIIVKKNSFSLTNRILEQRDEIGQTNLTKFRSYTYLKDTYRNILSIIFIYLFYFLSINFDFLFSIHQSMNIMTNIKASNTVKRPKHHTPNLIFENFQSVARNLQHVQLNFTYERYYRHGNTSFQSTSLVLDFIHHRSLVFIADSFLSLVFIVFLGNFLVPVIT